MKTCPACKTQYSDDTLKFCLQDGAPLAWPSATETDTVVLEKGETETVVSRGTPGRVNIPIGETNSPTWQPSRATQFAVAGPTKKSSNTVLAVAVTAAGMLILFGIIAVGALIFFKNRGQAGVRNADVPPNTNIAVSNTGYNSSPAPVATSTPWRTPPPNLATSTPKAAPPEPPATKLSSYPATSRLKFGRGSYLTSFSGDINPGDNRSLVLACRAGQLLTATVSSAGGCVRLRGAGSSLSITTTGGDNYVNVSNSCSTVVHFSVRISVF